MLDALVQYCTINIMLNMLSINVGDTCTKNNMLRTGNHLSVCPWFFPCYHKDFIQKLPNFEEYQIRQAGMYGYGLYKNIKKYAS